MMNALKWLGITLVAAIVALAIWAWTPDLDRAALVKKYASPASRFVDLGDLTVHVRDEGPRDAPVLLLIHGSSASLHTWERWVARLKGRYRIISYDQPGHGLTGPDPAGDYGAARMAGVADRLMTRLGVARYVVAGNSMGGWTAWNLALAHPAKIRGLVLVDAAGAPDARPKSTPIGFRLAQTPGVSRVLVNFTPRILVERSLKQTVADPGLVDDAMTDRYWELLRFPGTRADTPRRFGGKRTPASPEQMARLTMPTMVMWGAEDSLIPLEAGRWFARALPNDRFIAYPGIGHIPMEEAPDRSAADLERWLATLPSAR